MVTSHRRPVASIAPVQTRAVRSTAARVRNSLLNRLHHEPVVDIGRWKRDELYECRPGPKMRLALDTNILAYAEGLGGSSKKKLAVEIIEKLPPDSTLLPVQVLAELFHVLVRKAKRPPDRLQAAIVSWQDSFPLIETSPTVLLAAADLKFSHRPPPHHLGRHYLFRRCGCRMPPIAL